MQSKGYGLSLMMAKVYVRLFLPEERWHLGKWQRSGLCQLNCSFRGVNPLTQYIVTRRPASCFSFVQGLISSLILTLMCPVFLRDRHQQACHPPSCLLGFYPSTPHICFLMLGTYLYFTHLPSHSSTDSFPAPPKFCFLDLYILLHVKLFCLHECLCTMSVPGT